jgi:hypothetical protein
LDWLKKPVLMPKPTAQTPPKPGGRSRVRIEHRPNLLFTEHANASQFLHGLTLREFVSDCIFFTSGIIEVEQSAAARL